VALERCLESMMNYIVDAKSNKLKSLHYGREEKMHLLKENPR
jgi:hypothetical protein